MATEIEDWYDLDSIRDDVEGDYVLVNDLDEDTDGYDELAGPDANDGSGWEPIGDFDDWFSGSLDGGGNTISGLTIERGDEHDIGLFSVSELATFKDINIKDAYVEGDQVVSIISSTGSLCNFIGINIESSTLIGSTVAGTIYGRTNVQSGETDVRYKHKHIRVGPDVDVIASGSGWVYTGGLFGEHSLDDGEGSGGDIENCVFEGTVEADFHTGGIFGGFASNDGEGTDYNIRDCHFRGEIKSTDGSVGGIFGSIRVWDSVNVENCSSTGRIEFEGEDEADGLGGIVGSTSFVDEDADGEMQKCHSEVEIEVPEDVDVSHVGGIHGTSDTFNPNLQIRDCKFTGLVEGHSQVGGISGNISEGEEVIEKCFVTNEASITVFEDDGESGVILGVDKEGDGSEVDEVYSDLDTDLPLIGELEEGDNTGTTEFLTTDQMTGNDAPGYMDGFDFDETWDTTDEYPILAALVTTPYGYLSLVSADVTVSASESAGGLVGEVEAQAPDGADGVVVDSRTVGYVTGDSGGTGGLVGVSSASLTRAITGASVSGETEGAAIGVLDGEATHVYAGVEDPDDEQLVGDDEGAALEESEVHDLSDVTDHDALETLDEFDFDDVWVREAYEIPHLQLFSPGSTLYYGTVTDVDGQLVEGAAIETPYGWVRTDVNGRYEFGGPIESFEITGLSGTVDKDSQPDVDEPIDFQFGGLEVVLEDPSSGRPLEDVIIEIGHGDFYVQTDENGEVRIPTMPIEQKRVLAFDTFERYANVLTEGRLVEIDFTDDLPEPDPEEPSFEDIAILEFEVIDERSNPINETTAVVDIFGAITVSNRDGELLVPVPTHSIEPTIIFADDDPRYRTRRLELDPADDPDVGEFILTEATHSVNY
ncbi:hypothetical protein [Natrialbaceae archaeon AArc-T1-2]|uniref:hypothetical protein n=1 Tax=Natrialbaceae archaeon AArc-T1-2 TaxID=3053904 RepID=UPI00255A7B7C|nr:hypothetical protein [Natrialbaceae archaeon AArc-T1-2]WIV67554.1 hypothetical protein QQ977_02150 [Natrialbaceae archaeon AArc-T1-2]